LLFDEADLERAEDLVAELIEQTKRDAATTQQHDRDNRDDHGGVILFRLFGDGGHLFVHDFFSSVK
jgi:hypothetical protein